MLELSEDLRIALIVAGGESAALRAQREVLEWLSGLERTLARRTRRLAWIIEDADCRAWTTAWLSLTPLPLCNAPSAVFRTVTEAIAWLLQPSTRESDAASHGWPQQSVDPERVMAMTIGPAHCQRGRAYPRACAMS